MSRKLTPDQVLEARRRVAAGESASCVAAGLPVTVSVLCRAVRGLTWASLPGALPGYNLARGERHPNAALTDERVLQIRRDWARGGVTITQLARREGMGRTAVSRAIHGKAWKHLGRA